MPIRAQFYSGSDTFSTGGATPEEIDREMEQLREVTHAREAEKSRGLPRMIYINPVLAEAKRRGIVISKIRPPLRYRITEMRETIMSAIRSAWSRFRWFWISTHRTLAFRYRYGVWP